MDIDRYWIEDWQDPRSGDEAWAGQPLSMPGHNKFIPDNLDFKHDIRDQAAALQSDDPKDSDVSIALYGVRKAAAGGGDGARTRLAHGYVNLREVFKGGEDVEDKLVKLQDSSDDLASVRVGLR